MNDARRQIIAVLHEANEFLARPDNNFLWSWWNDANEATEELSRFIAALESGRSPRRTDLSVMFAPTGPIQEVSLSSGWGDEFLGLGARFDAASARFYGLAGALETMRDFTITAVAGIRRFWRP